MITNRWYTKNGKAKRVDSLFANFKDDAESVKPMLMKFNAIGLTTYMRRKFGVGLFEGLNMVIACYWNVQ